MKTENLATACLLALAAPALAQPYCVYVGDIDSNPNTVAVIDTAGNTVRTTIPVDSGPRGIAISPDGHTAYVTNCGDCLSSENPSAGSTVDVVDMASNSVTSTIPVGSGPYHVALTPDGGTAYVTNFGLLGSPGDTVSVVGTASNTVTATIGVGGNPAGVAVTPDGRSAYVTNGASNSVSVIDTATNSVAATIPLRFGPFDVAFTPDGRTAYVAGGTNDLAVINTATRAVTTIPITGQHLGPALTGLALTPDGTRAFVTSISNGVTVIDTANDTVTTTLSVGVQTWAIAVTPDGRAVYVADITGPGNGGGNVYAIDTSTNLITNTVQLGGALASIAIAPFPCPSPPTPTPTPIACVGDCNGDDMVTVDEILIMVNIALGTADPSACPHGVAQTPVTIDEILTAVNNALQACQ